MEYLPGRDLAWHLRAQGALSDGEWFGRPDVLRRVATPSMRWKWSYEVEDTKLARETKATTILQLSLYSDLLAKIQGMVPEFLRVVPPGEGFAGEKYRVSEYAAYSRFVMKRLRGAVGVGGSKETYPEPVEHCSVCRWFRECDARRRAVSPPCPCPDQRSEKERGTPPIVMPRARQSASSSRAAGTPLPARARIIARAPAPGRAPHPGDRSPRSRA